MKKKYAVTQDLNENYKQVSTIDPKTIPLAYHHDLTGSQGCWGLIDNEENIIITPKYMFPLQPIGKYYLACLGDGWISYGKWKEKEVFWTDSMAWGVVDEKGNEIVPVVYEKIERLNTEDESDIFIVYRNQYRPYKMEQIAIIDDNNEYLMPFIYNSLLNEVHNNQIIVYKNGDRLDSNVMCGVYDIKLKREIIKPKKEYRRIERLNDNVYLVCPTSASYNNSTLLGVHENVIGEESAWRSISYNKETNLYEAVRVSGEAITFNIVDDQIVDEQVVERKIEDVEPVKKSKSKSKAKK